jgi:hypothetical protein
MGFGVRLLLVASLLIWCPILASTLIYGSGDGCVTINNISPEFSSIWGALAQVCCYQQQKRQSRGYISECCTHCLVVVAQALNLKEHRVDPINGQGCSIVGPFDIEGHIGAVGGFRVTCVCRVYECL